MALKKDKFFLLTFMIMCLLPFPDNSYCAPISLPASIQAALLKKIFKYNSVLKELDTVKVAIVYDANMVSAKDRLYDSMHRAAINVSAVTAEKNSGGLAGFNVAYLLTDSKEYSKLCKDLNILTLSGLPQDAEQGNVSLAFGIENNQPRIYLNLTSLQAEGSEMAAELLKYARVYK